MVESIEDYAMFMVDPKGHITSWNRGAERLTGYTESEALGRPFSILYPKGELSEDHALYELSMAKLHGHHEEEGVRVRKDGSIYNAQIVVWPVENKFGELIGFAKITRDVTERRRAERALKDSEAKFRVIADAMPQIVWSVLPSGEQDYANKQWFQFTGMDPASPVENVWLERVHPDERDQAKSSWLKSLSSGKDFEGQFRLRHHSGSYRWILGRALPLRDDNGKIIRWMGTLTDIHDQKEAESALHETARRKDDFLAMLAHELRNPLAPIRNSTALIRRLCPSDDQVVNFIDIIERQVHHMTRLIDDLLDVARISRGKIELRLEKVELGELIRHAVEDFRPEYEQKGVYLHVDTPADSMELAADRTRITQSIGNLLHNALKFCGSECEVSVSLRREQRGQSSIASIRVKDTGVGIDPGLLEKLFVPFIQASQDLARSQGGLGLGLALIKGFVELHGGSVEARRPGPGRGAEFLIYLPLPNRIPNARRVSASLPAESSLLKIVLIDDNRDMVESLAALLTVEGHEVRGTYDGESGIDLIQSEKPDLVLCDIGLPGARDGYAVARAIRAAPSLSLTYLVALSGYGQEQDRRLSKESGFDDHLLKPVNLSDLAVAIAAAGAKRRGS